MVRKKKTTATAFEVRLSQNALQNIDEITGYIAFINHQPSNAIKVGDAILQTIDRIAANPFAFRECEEMPTKTKIYRRAACHSWSIIYKITGDVILILGIIVSVRGTHSQKLGTSRGLLRSKWLLFPVLRE